MTKERAINLCHAIDQYLCAGNPIWDTAEIHDAISMAIKALKAQVTLDDVSNAYENGYQQGKFEALQSQQKTGKWWRRAWSIECSECGYDMPFAIRNYCPNCGAKMENES